MNAIQSAFQEELSGLRGSLSLDQLRAASNISKCRTWKMGAREYRCESGETGHDYCYLYNSCHYRHCPQCNAIPRSRWLEGFESKLLNCAHRQIVFTVPHELNSLWLYNKRELSNLFFRSVSKTLKLFLQDSNWLGGTAGFSLILHTWGRNLSLHPHIHAVVSEGGLDEEGEWQQAKHKDFLPAVAMMHKFRGAYISGIRKLLREQELVLPEGCSEAELRKILNQVYLNKKWNLRVEKAHPKGKGLVKYLSRYLKGGPISPSQVKSNGGAVIQRYKDHRTGLTRRHRFSKRGFVKQLLVHIPPKSMPMIRHYGLYSGSKQKERQDASEQLPGDKEEFSFEEYMLSMGIERSPHCSVCSREMKVRRFSFRELSNG